MLVFLVSLMGLFVMMRYVECRGARTATLQCTARLVSGTETAAWRLFGDSGDTSGTLSQIVES